MDAPSRDEGNDEGEVVGLGELEGGSGEDTGVAGADEKFEIDNKEITLIILRKSNSPTGNYQF